MNTELGLARASEGQGFGGELELTATPSSPSLARRFTRAFLRRLGIYSITDTACLVVSELATNAVCAYKPHNRLASRSDGSTALIRIRLHANGERLRIEVWDQAAGLPVLHAASADSECGRGLALVGAMTEGRWGWRPAVLPWTAKCVWAEIRHPAFITHPPPSALPHHQSNPETGGRNMTTIETEAAPPSRTSTPTTWPATDSFTTTFTPAT